MMIRVMNEVEVIYKLACAPRLTFLKINAAHYKRSYIFFGFSCASLYYHLSYLFFAGR